MSHPFHCYFRNRISPLTVGVIDNKKKNQNWLDFINEPMETTVGDDPPNVPPERDELADLVRCIVRAGDGRKAENIGALRVSHVSSVTSFIVTLCGNSRPQNQAIAAAIKKEVSEEFDMLPGATGVPEGNAESGWIVLDYGSVMVHIMTPKSRLYYNIEGQWKENGGESMDLSDVIIPNTIEGGTSGGTMNLSKDEDPFWS
jgi:ribosome-associated protein